MMRIRIKIIGSNCSNGIKLTKMVSRACQEIEEPIEVETVADPKENKRYGITNVPGLVIDGTVVSQGKVLTVREIKKLLA